jgi:hypothetical protein
MIPSKPMVGMLVVLCVGMMAFSVQAQEEPAYMYLKEQPKPAESDSTLSDTIYTGKVIVYGEMLQPPYIVEFKKDTLWVNNIPVNPTITPWHEEPPKRTWTGEISDSCFADYYSFRPHHTLQETKRMILEKYMANPLVDSIIFQPDHGEFTAILFQFTNGWKGGIEVHKLGPDGKFLPSAMDVRRLSPEQKAAMREGEGKWARSELRKGSLVVFSRVFYTAKSSGMDMNLFVDCLRRIAIGQISVEQAKVEYPKLLPDADSFWEEFEHNEDTWK